MGVIPSSIKVPRFDAIIIRSQYNGSDVSANINIYSGDRAGIDIPEETMP